MKALIILPLVFSAVIANCQGEGPLNLTVTNDSIVMDLNDPKLVLQLQLSNLTNSNLILYRLKSETLLPENGDIDLFCNTKIVGAGTVVLLFDEDHHRIFPIHWHVNDLKNPVTHKDLEKSISSFKEKSVQTTSVAHISEEISFVSVLDFSDFPLKRGHYYLQILYMAGDKIENFVSKEQQVVDQKKYRAGIFKGCVISSKYSVMLR